MMTDPNKISQLVALANGGDRLALEQLLRHAKDKVHRLSLRMLVDPDTAQDATQEILIRIMTKLSTYRSESAFDTWVYRLAMNHLLNMIRASRAGPQLEFSAFAQDLESGLEPDAQSDPEDAITLNELRITCTMAMLLCLGPNQRAAYILGEIFEFDQGEAADVLEITHESFRKRLSRARAQVHDFTARHCGLANPAAACSCPRRLPAAQRLGRVGGAAPGTFGDAPSYATVRDKARRTEAAHVAALLQRATGSLRSPKDVVSALTPLLSPKP